MIEILIDAMHPHPQVKESFGHQPRTHRKQTRLQFHAVAKMKRPRINKIRKAIKQKPGHIKRNLARIDGLIACGGCLLIAGRHIYQKLLVISRLVRQQTILYHEDSRIIPDCIVSLWQTNVRPIVCGKLVAMLSSGPRSQSLSPAKDSPSSIT